MENYFYSSISGIALAVHLIINWRQLFGRRNVPSHTGMHEFRRFLVCLLFFFQSDFLWGILAELKCPRLLYIDTICFFLTMAFSAQGHDGFPAKIIFRFSRFGPCIPP